MPCPKDNVYKFKLTIAFDGARYAGWQVQKTGTGVQEVIERAFQKIFPSVTRIHSSSRTDTGVHALGMVAHVEIPASEFKMTFRKLPLALNAFLPEDIRVLAAARVSSDFHARFNAAGKEYRYFVWNARAMNPLWRHMAWFVSTPLDFASMRIAAGYFVGEHDFESFAGTRSYKMKSTVRTLRKCEFKRAGALITFRLEGDGFLYKMCRGIIGTLIQVGQGRFKPDDIGRMLVEKNRRLAGMTAPAHGLVLWKVFYPTRTRPRTSLAP